MHMGESEKAIAQLQMLRDTLIGFSKLIEALSEASARYGIPVKGIQADDTFVTTLTATLEPEKLGLLVKAILGTQNLHQGMKNFMNYDQYELDDLNDKLKSTIKDFNQVLDGLA